ncbi:hypothetical protein BH23PLA1_BH23PLA1_32380 [soil metagenome]
MRRLILALTPVLLLATLSAGVTQARQAAPRSIPAPPEEPPPLDPMGAARSPRHLLRNGNDYLRYGEFTRALVLFREAEARDNELTAAEVKQLKQGIAAALKGLHNPSPQSGSGSGSGPGPQPGTIALAEPAPGSTPPISPDGILLTSATVSDTEPPTMPEPLPTPDLPQEPEPPTPVEPEPPTGGPATLTLPPLPAGPFEPTPSPPISAPPLGEPDSEPEPEPPTGGPATFTLPPLPAGPTAPEAPQPFPSAVAPETPEPFDLPIEPMPSEALEEPNIPIDLAASASISPPQPGEPDSEPETASLRADDTLASPDPLPPLPRAAEELLSPEVPSEVFEVATRPDLDPAPIEPPPFETVSPTNSRGDVYIDTLPPELRRGVEEIARRQEEEQQLRGLPPFDLPRGYDDEDESAFTSLDLPRAPSPTEPIPIESIPVPEEYVPIGPRQWAPRRKLWVAAATCHGPLYFQDAVLERYGQGVEQSVGPIGRFLSYPLDDPTQTQQRNQIAQPFVSAGLFAAQIVLWPYNLIMDPPGEAEYDLGYHRPGDRIPPGTIYLPPFGVGPALRGKHY